MHPSLAPATVSISDTANVCPALKQLCALLNQDVNFVEISSSRGDTHIKKDGGCLERFIAGAFAVNRKKKKKEHDSRHFGKQLIFDLTRVGGLPYREC